MVNGCSSRSEKGHKLFNFPSKQRRRQQWEEKLNIQAGSHDRVCYKHFTPSCLIDQGDKLRLLPSALPTLRLGACRFHKQGRKREATENAGRRESISLVDTEAVLEGDKHFSEQAMHDHNYYSLHKPTGEGMVVVEDLPEELGAEEEVDTTDHTMHTLVVENEALLQQVSKLEAKVSSLQAELRATKDALKKKECNSTMCHVFLNSSKVGFLRHTVTWGWSFPLI